MYTNNYLLARKTLPKIPEEIFELWLDGRIKSNGWPPTSPRWQGALRNKPIEFWQKLEWEKRSVILRYEKFTESTKRIIKGLIEACFLGIINSYSSIEDSPKRIHKIIEFIKENLVLPSYLICMEDGEFYEIIDGCHRLAVFFALKAKLDIKEEHIVWMGFLPNTSIKDKIYNNVL